MVSSPVSTSPRLQGHQQLSLCGVLGVVGVKTLLLFLRDPVSKDLEGSKILKGRGGHAKGTPGEAGFLVFVLFLCMFGDRVLASNSLLSCKRLIFLPPPPEYWNYRHHHT